MKPPRDERFAVFWLLLPWFTLGSVFIAAVIGLDRWIATHLPYGLGRIARNNVGWGMLLVTLGSSARWVYLRFWNRSRRVGDLVGTVIIYTIAITVAQIFVAAFLFVCAIVVGLSWR